MKSSKDGLNRRFDTVSQNISIDTEMDNMRGSHQGKERIKSTLCLTRISAGEAEDGKAALEGEWQSVIQKPNAEKTYSFTQETFSECLTHGCGALEAILPREDRLHQDSQTHDRFLQSKMEGAGQIHVLQSGARIKKQPLLKNTASSSWALEEHRSRMDACPPCPRPLDPAPLFWSTLLFESAHSRDQHSRCGARIYRPDIQTYHSLFQAEDVKTRPRILTPAFINNLFQNSEKVTQSLHCSKPLSPWVVGPTWIIL